MTRARDRDLSHPGAPGRKILKREVTSDTWISLTTLQRCPGLNAPLRSPLSLSLSFFPPQRKRDEKREITPLVQTEVSLNPPPVPQSCSTPGWGGSPCKAGRADPEASRTVPAYWHQELETEPLMVTATERRVLYGSLPHSCSRLAIILQTCSKSYKDGIMTKRPLVQYADTGAV